MHCNGKSFKTRDMEAAMCDHPHARSGMRVSNIKKNTFNDAYKSYRVLYLDKYDKYNN